MRLLHTADLHLGRHFNGIPLDEDHDAILDQIVSTAVDRQVDALIIAGDVFDRAAPPTGAVRQFNRFLSRFATETDAAAIVIAGNHDSGDRIDSMSLMTDVRRALIRGVVSPEEKPLILKDVGGPVAISGLPFAYENAARECFGDETIQAPQDVLAAQIFAARRHVPMGTRWVIVAHAFVAGGKGSDGERPLARAGGIETVGPELFDGANYVALGHLHRPQFAGDRRIRYSGSPLAFGFDEAGTEKSMSLVEIDPAGQAAVEEIPFEPKRGLRILRGKHAELLQAEKSTDFVKVVLSDETPVIDGMKRLRDVFPYACEMSYERDERVQVDSLQKGPGAGSSDPIEVVGGFVEFVREDPLNEAEKTIVADALERIREEENAE